MSHHDLMLASFAAWSAVLALASFQLAAETRYRVRCARRERLTEASAVASEKP